MTTPITIRPLTGTIAAHVDGFDVTSFDETAAAQLRNALTEHHVLVLGAQEMTDQQHHALASVFGTPHPHPVARWMGSKDVVAYVRNDADNPPVDDSDFHTDYTFHTHIASVAVLQGQVVTSRGGDTIWADAGAAYASLSVAMQDFLCTLDAHHTLGPRFVDVMRQRYGDELADKVGEAFGGAAHPVVVAHPVTGQPALFVNPGYTDAIIGLHPNESSSLLTMLFDILGQPKFHYRHHWSTNDIVIWDEYATVHQGPNDFYPESRVLRRVTAGDTVPLAYRR